MPNWTDDESESIGITLDEQEEERKGFGKLIMKAIKSKMHKYTCPRCGTKRLLSCSVSDNYWCINCGVVTYKELMEEEDEKELHTSR